MDNQHQKITGYRDLKQEEIDLMNRIKELGKLVGTLCDDLKNPANIAGDIEPDQRWVAVGTSLLQQGFMALTRSIAKPTSF